MSCPWNFLTAIIKMPCKRDNSKRNSKHGARRCWCRALISKWPVAIRTTSFSNGHRNEYQFDVCYGRVFAICFFLSQTWTSAIQSSDLHNCPRIIKFFEEFFFSVMVWLLRLARTTRIVWYDTVLLASCSILFSFHFLKLSSTDKKTTMSSDCSKCAQSCNLSKSRHGSIRHIHSFE